MQQHDQGRRIPQLFRPVGIGIVGQPGGSGRQGRGHLDGSGEQDLGIDRSRESDGQRRKDRDQPHACAWGGDSMISVRTPPMSLG